MFKIVPFNVPPGRRNVAGDFHRPYGTQDVLRFSVQRAARKAQRCGRFSSPLRNSGCFTLQRSTCRTESATLRAIFIAPTKLRMFYVAAFNVPPGKHNIAGDFHRPKLRMFYVAAFNVPPGNRNVAGDFHRPYETQDVLRCSVQRVVRKAQCCGRFSSPLRNSGCFTLQCSTCRSESAALRAIFIAPTKSRSQRGSGKRKYWYTPRATTTVDIDTRGKAG